MKNSQAGRARKVGQGSKWLYPPTRMAIYHRDGFACAYCGAGSEDDVTLTVDHIQAAEHGGTNDSTNLITACLSCNSAKQDRSPRAWNQYLAQLGRSVDWKAIRRQAARPLDRAEGRRLLRLRQESK